MATMNDKQIALAKIYSQSMLDLAEKSGDADTVLAELNALLETFASNPDLEGYFSSPIINPQDRAKSIEKLFRGRMTDVVVDSLQILNRKGRLGILRAVVATYLSAMEDRRQIAEVAVTTAIPISDSIRSKLLEAAGRRFGRQIRLVEKVDDSIVGGIIIRFGDEKIDASVATQLRKLGDALAERASREIQQGRSLVA